MTAVNQNGDVARAIDGSHPPISSDVLPGLDDEDPSKAIIKTEDLTGAWTFWLVFSTVVLSLGAGSQMGYNSGAMTVCAPFILEFLNETNYDKWNGNAPHIAITWIYSCTVTIYAVGGAIGAVIGGRYSDALGRKTSMITSSFLSPLSGLLMGISQKSRIYGLLFLGRLIIGLYAGISLIILPVYLAEISPINLRGAVGAISVFFICFGQLLSHIVGFWAFYDQQLWPIFLSLTGAMGMLVIVAFPFCPESPRWLYLVQKRYTDAEIALRHLRGSSADISAEMKEMRKEAQYVETNRVSSEEVTATDILRLRNPEWKMPLLIFFYTTEIYTTAGLDQSEIAVATVAYSSINVAMTVLGVLLVDKVGRRPLLLYPMMGSLFILLGLTVSIETQDDLDWMKWVTIGLIYLFTAFFGVGPVAVKNLVAAELWMQYTRPAAMSVYFQVTWWAMVFVSLTFPLLNENIGGYTFLVYFVCLVAATLFLFRNLPETKNRTFEQISANFKIKQHRENISTTHDPEECETQGNGDADQETDIDSVT